MSSMTTTTEEDTELRDLVAATLENAGVLGKIKAQLRANVYIALEEGNQHQECGMARISQIIPKVDIYIFTICTFPFFLFVAP